jgi:hypothetical protein
MPDMRSDDNEARRQPNYRAPAGHSLTDHKAAPTWLNYVINRVTRRDWEAVSRASASCCTGDDDCSDFTGANVCPYQLHYAANKSYGRPAPC